MARSSAGVEKACLKGLFFIDHYDCTSTMIDKPKFMCLEGDQFNKHLRSHPPSWNSLSSILAVPTRLNQESLVNEIGVKSTKRFIHHS